MRFSILGPLLVHDASGEPVTIGGARLRTLLGLLLLRPGQWVAADHLLESVWSGAPPAGAANALQALVSRLRRALAAGAAVEGGPEGYRLDVAPDRVDLCVFEDLVRAGRGHRAAGRPGPALADLDRALGLWRGPALVDLTAQGLAEGVAARLDQTHLTAREERLAALLDLGRTADAVAEAGALAGIEPHRERPVELLLRALAAAGRTADAVAAYEGFRARLADDVGLDPSPHLEDVHLRLLRGQLSAPAAPDGPGAPGPSDRWGSPAPTGRGHRAAPGAADPGAPGSGGGAGRSGSAPSRGLWPPASADGGAAAPESTGSGIGSSESAPSRGLRAPTGDGGVGPEAAGLGPGSSESALSRGLWAPAGGGAGTGGGAAGAVGTPLHLPVPLTGFVPRAEVGITVDLLAHGRLVTLTGPGGAGKTRLAVEGAAAFAAGHPDLASRGAWFVELAPLTDGASLPEALADTLGLREHALLQPRSAPPPPPVERVAAFIADHPVLLVLDNCEHLVDDAARLAALLLERCPRLRVLATSREPLGTPGEHLLPVPSLPLPAEDSRASEAAAAPSVVLFAERARAVRPGFAVTDDNAPHVVRIVRALDGLPLALELAAARLRAMTPAQLAARLDDRFRLLGGGVRHTPRHSTLRAVVDWSWELLDEAERRLLRRLSVFAGGTDLESVEHVCADPGTPGTVAGRDVWTVLFALVDKSLAVAEEPRRADAPPRYRLLETVRAYAAERLTGAGEDAAVRDAHAHRVRDLWKEADRLLRGPRQAETIARLHDENDGFAAAVRWAVERRDVHLVLDLVEYSQWYWTLSDSWEPLARWAGQALDMMGDTTPEGRAVGRASCLFHRAAATTDSLDDIQGHVRAIEEVLAEEGRLPEEHPLLVYTLMYRAMTEDGRGEARDRIARALERPDPWMRAMVRMMLSLVDMLLGRFRPSLEQAEAALAEFRALGDAWGVCQALAQVVDAHRFDDLERCEDMLLEAVALAEAQGLESMAAVFRVRRVQVLIFRGETAAARAELDLLAARGRPAQPEHAVLVLLAEAQWQREVGDLVRARELVERLEATVETLGGFAPAYVEVGACALAATISWDEGDPARARREAARSWWGVIGTMGPIRAELLEVLAAVSAEEEPHLAARLVGWAWALRGVPDDTDPHLAHTVARLRDKLGAPEYDRLVEEAAAPSPDEVLTAASRWLAEAVPEEAPADRR
ncbi:AfsR/SARP family transcriptional regulator [Nocardiopsis changdeensis]|uniref:AfsR/SARP family transcriptional regulator n=1 Tax=Nocardiopsis TaxID=2013 RepID=UPI00210501CC|nr:MULTISPECIES: BTAD domain-containing putative transcriptional regulator [Nocardiopsis]